jgi:hypothetical protein
MGDAVRPVWYRRIVQPMPFLVLGEALSFASNTLLARLQDMAWDPGDGRLRDALADAAEAGARATESWGAVA